MARTRRARPSEPLPPPLPPAERTVGQLVAETIRLYGRRFFPSLALGLSFAVVNQINIDRTTRFQVAVLLAVGTPLLTAAYVAGCALAAERRPEPARFARAFTAGALVFLPVPFLVQIYVLPAVAWLALTGLVVPVIVVEGRGFRDGIRRAFDLARADYVHAVGSLATLLLVFLLTRTMLAILLRSQGEATDRIGVFLADLVLSPILYLGAALLYHDQAARLIDSASPKRRRRRRRDADLHPAHDPHGAGGADAEVEPGPAARGER
jgi:hypothetical protein